MYKIFTFVILISLMVDLIPGVLNFSSSNIKTCPKRGYIMKEFRPIFNSCKKFMVRTNKINERNDMYVIVNIVYNTENNHWSDDDVINCNNILYGTINKYIGYVGDMCTEKYICKIMGTCHWSLKINNLSNISSEKTNSIYDTIGIQRTDITPTRMDFTNEDILTLTVDPLGSRDFDDAISIIPSSNDNMIYNIIIHIADPTSYIIEDSVIDIEAAQRVETLYLQSETMHMFPENLSTDVFSLKANTISRAFSVLCEIMLNDDGSVTIIQTKICKTLINVKYNMSYNEFEEKYKKNPLMNTLYEIGKSIHKSKNDDYFYDSHKMIEMYMILANETVANYLVTVGNTSQFHDLLLIRSQTNNLKTIQCNKTEFHKKLVNIHNRLSSNSAKLCIYSNNCNNRHDSLNLDLYTHFTSPIRRYSDIIVHRILYNLMVKENNVFKLTKYRESATKIIKKMNYYKKYYKKIIALEQNILITHNIISTIKKDPVDRSLEAFGYIVDIDDTQDIKKIYVYCTSILSDNLLYKNQEFYDIENNLKNTIHVIKIHDLYNDEFKLFDKIKFKICFLNKDINKLRAYI